MSPWEQRFKNYATTLFGFAAGAGTYLLSVGPKLPTTNVEWAQFGVSAFLAGLGYVAKDATTGSGPGAKN